VVLPDGRYAYGCCTGEVIDGKLTVEIDLDGLGDESGVTYLRVHRDWGSYEPVQYTVEYRF
jgi:hypothetical protein